MKQNKHLLTTLLSLWLCLFSFDSLHSQNKDASNTVLPTEVATIIAGMNKSTPIKLEYNKQVQAYIDAYTIRRREHLSNIIGRSQQYFPLFEQCLDKYGLPLELKNLAIIESALDPRAKSTSGAMGLWQFLYHAAAMFDLKITTYTDERCDAIKSTEAACKYLQYLYRNFNDWHLALAAYNTGIVEVKKAIERSGGKTNIWELQPYLPEAARSYIPAFIAATYVMANYEKYHITPTPPRYTHLELDTVWVTKSLAFEQISKAINVSVEDLTMLNPIYTKNYIPYNNQTPSQITIPTEKTTLFIREEKKLHETTAPSAQSMLPPIEYERSKIIHIVDKGEYFHKIAMKYQCTVEDLMTWNKLQTRSVMAGQQLVIWIKKPKERFFFIQKENINNNQI